LAGVPGTAHGACDSRLVARRQPGTVMGAAYDVHGHRVLCVVSESGLELRRNWRGPHRLHKIYW